MTKKKRVKAHRRKQKTRRRRFTKVFSWTMEVLRRHRIAAILSGTIALLGSLASIYALSEPDIVAISPTTTANGALRMEPDGSLSHWMEIEQRFKNNSWKGGGHITAIQMVPHATWLTTKIVPNNSETFAAYEERVVKFNALFQFPEITLDKRYPDFVVDIQFLDQKGAVIKEYSSGKPYSFQLTITQSGLDSLKALSGSNKQKVQPN